MPSSPISFTNTVIKVVDSYRKSLCPSSDLHVRLWTQYFSRLDNHSTLASTFERPLIELHRLEDVRVNDRIESQLDSGEYDDDILKVII